MLTPYRCPHCHWPLAYSGLLSLLSCSGCTVYYPLRQDEAVHVWAALRDDPPAPPAPLPAVWAARERPGAAHDPATAADTNGLPYFGGPPPVTPGLVYEPGWGWRHTFTGTAKQAAEDLFAEHATLSAHMDRAVTAATRAVPPFTPGPGRAEGSR